MTTALKLHKSISLTKPDHVLQHDFRCSKEHLELQSNNMIIVMISDLEKVLNLKYFSLVYIIL